MIYGEKITNIAEEGDEFVLTDSGECFNPEDVVFFKRGFSATTRGTWHEFE